jgi:hypothetical protein
LSTSLASVSSVSPSPYSDPRRTGADEREDLPSSFMSLPYPRGGKE